MNTDDFNGRHRSAEVLALNALRLLAEDPERLGAFLGAAGATPQEAHARAGDPEFLGFVLDFILQDDEAVLALARREGVAPEAVLRARAALPGGDAPHWT